MTVVMAGEVIVTRTSPLEVQLNVSAMACAVALGVIGAFGCVSAGPVR